MFNDITIEKQQAQATFISKVYGWMALALLVTGLTAFYAANNESVLETIFGNRLFFWALIIGEFGLVWYLSARIMTMSAERAKLLCLFCD